MTSYYLGIKGIPGLRGTILIAPAIKNNDDRKFGKILIKCVGKEEINYIFVLGKIFPRMRTIEHNWVSSNKNP